MTDTINTGESPENRLDHFLDRFEEAWKTADQPPEIEQYLPATGDSLRSTVLTQLVKIDLEYRYRTTADPSTSARDATMVPLLLDDYAAKFCELADRSQIPVDLVVHEYRTRRWSGERPSHAEYFDRFPSLSDLLRPELDRVDRERFAPVAKQHDIIVDRTSPSHTHETEVSQATTISRDSNSTANSDSSLPEKFGDYEILDEIARGGMGVVYRAHQISLDRIVALKVIGWGKLAGDEEVRRFHVEAQAAAQLEHPGIVPIFDVGQSAGYHYFTMALVEGQSLSSNLAHGPMSPRDAARVMEQVGRAIEYAHEKGIVHRDLKPGNILIAPETGSSNTNIGTPKVTDFGLAKRLTADEQWTASGQVMGTPGYMPPEQAEGRLDAIGPLSDVYSLGATLYALLTGRPPFQAASPVETIQQVVAEEPVSPRQLNSAVGRDLETICLKCLEKTPHRRYASAGEFAEDLRRFLDGRPIVARPISAIGRSIRWYARHKVVATLLILFVAALIGGLIGTSLGLNRARSEEAAKNQQLQRALKAEQETSQQLTRAVAAEALANQRFDRVRDYSLRLLFDAIDRSERIQNGSELRRLLVQSGLKELEALAQDKQRGAAILSSLADAYMRLARMQGDTDTFHSADYRGAVRTCGRAIAILKRSDLPVNTKRVKHRIARCHLLMGKIYAEHNLADKARAEFETAAEIGNQIVAAGGEDREAQSLLGEIELTLGTFEFKRKSPRKTVQQHFDRAQELGRKLAAVNSPGDEEILLYAQAKTQAGVLAVMNKEAANGIALLKESADLMRRVIRKTPRNLKARAMLAESELFQSLASLGLKDNAGFQSHFKQAVGVNLPYLELTTRNYGAVKQTGRWFARQTAILKGRNKPLLAIDCLRKAIEIHERLLEFHPDDHSIRRILPPLDMELSHLLFEINQTVESDNVMYRSLTRMLMLDRYTPGRQTKSAEIMFHGGRLQMGQGFRTEEKTPTSSSRKFRARKLNLAIRIYRTMLSHWRELSDRSVKLPSHLPSVKELESMINDCEQIRDILARDTEPGYDWEARLQEWNLRYVNNKRPELNATAFAFLAQTYEKAGQPMKALSAYKRSVQIRRKMEKSKPADRANLHNLAVNYQDIGLLWKSQKRNDEARDAWGKSITLVEQLLKLQPGNARHRYFKAALLLNVGQLSSKDKPSLALQSVERGIPVLKSLVRSYPANVEYLSTYAEMQFLQFLVLKKTNAHGRQSAAKAGRLAVVLMKQLADNQPRVPLHRFNLAGARVEFGKFLIAIDDTAAESHLAEAVRLLTPLAQSKALRKECRRLLCDAHISRARLFDQRREHRRATPHWMEAKKNDDGRRATELFEGATLSMVRSGDHALVARVLDRILSRARGAIPYNHFIRLSSLCAITAARDNKLNETQRRSLIERYTSRAVQILTRADKAGYFGNRARIRQLAFEPDFAALRKHAEFRRFLAQKSFRLPVPAPRPR